MNRSSRALGLVLPLLLAASLTAVAGPADARSPQHGGSRAERASELDHAASATTHWPVVSRTGTFVHDSANPAPTGVDPARTLVKETVVQDPAAGTIGFTVQLAAIPTAATDSHIVVAFGTVGGGICNSPAGSNVVFDAFALSGGTSATISDSNHALPAAKGAAWDCAFAQSLSTDEMTKYDSVIGPLVDHVERPILSFHLKGGKLKNGAFTKVHFTIANSGKTIAVAKHVKLSWKTHHVLVKGDKSIGTIKPGQKKKGLILVEPVGHGKGKIKLTARSGDYKSVLTINIHPIKSHGHGHHHR